MAERGSPERRRRIAKLAERDLHPAPRWNRDEQNLLLDADGALGLVLWQRARDVRLWASFGRSVPPHLFSTPKRAQRRLHDAAAAEAPQIDGPLTILFEMVRQPDSFTGPRVCAACLQISEWASEGNKLETALAFAEAAAAADPSSAEAAAVAGMLCLRVPPESERVPASIRAASWLRRAARLGRRAKDWEWYIRAHIRLGLLLYHLGEFAAARRMYDRAAWMAHWFGRTELAGKAHHDLLAIEGDIGTLQSATHEAQTSLALYPLRHERIPYLVHDIAFYALVRNRFFSSARTVLDAVWSYIPPENRLIINGTVARVAAALRDRERYESSASHVCVLAELCQDGATWAYVHIAEGARFFGEWDRAERYAARALELAMLRRELDAQRTAYTLLDSIMLRVPGPPEEKSTPGFVTALVRSCLTRLAKLREPDLHSPVPMHQVVPTAWAP